MREPYEYAQGIGYQKKTNPALQIFDRKRVVDFLTADLPPAPPDFKRMIGLNRDGSPEMQTQLTELQWEEVRAKIPTGAKLLDIREPEHYWTEHLPGSQSVPFTAHTYYQQSLFHRFPFEAVFAKFDSTTQKAIKVSSRLGSYPS
ncbi:MAG: hypothetical protein HXX08_07310 [Chloroflexi bacterium]|uniref:Rhodanese domain-containing protein n=1 Tax=Candidatus Chlorohelix allophototropha TaxID=3003348 RepID=A0A8T7M1Q5_9CHLR|nr:hypothetical protein [Chloroflexota bacterium]WJW67540.1 hypothetical protein OZ401_000807 [Chloroflexota bacterium L227-S17]